MHREFYNYKDPITGFETSYREASEEEANKKWGPFLMRLHGARDVDLNAFSSYSSDLISGPDSVGLPDLEREV